MTTATLMRHGNVKGWRRHQRANEKPCDACAKARADYDERRRNSDAETRAARIRGRAQVRAYQRLAHEFPEKYASYYAEAKEQVAAEVADLTTPPTATSDPAVTSEQDDPTVCIAHGAHIPCRKDGEHRYTSNPYWVKSVRDYQGSPIVDLTWEPAWERT